MNNNDLSERIYDTLGKKELYELLDIEDTSDFQYFENLASLLECEDDIVYETLCELISEIDMDVFSSLVEEYFNDLTEHIPGSEIDIFTILDNVRMSMKGMAKNLEKDEMSNLASEIERFRLWYSRDSKVYCEKIGEGEEECLPVRDALVLSRLEKLNGEKYYYDFSEAQDFKLDEYVMSFRDMIAEEDDGEASDYYKELDEFDGYEVEDGEYN